MAKKDGQKMPPVSLRDSEIMVAPADRAGIVSADLIIEIDQKPVKNVDAFYLTLREKKSYFLKVRRNDWQNHETFVIIILHLKD